MIDERLNQIAEHYGLDEQLNMLQEECAELIQAVSKYRRNPTFESYAHICEEIADVEIMTEQIVYLFGKSNPTRSQVEEIKKAKIDRQNKRMGGEMKGGAINDKKENCS